MNLLSVVVPCYNEQEVIEETHRQLSAELDVLAARHDLDWELIYVNDGSADRTLALLHEMHSTQAIRFAKRESRGQVRIVSLARNFGHQIALSAGLENAKGDATVAIDADLQDPPQVIGQMVEKWLAGADVVYGVRSTRVGESRFKLLTARLFYKTVRNLTRIDIPLDTGDFRLMSRAALDVLIGMKERHRFIRGMVPWIGLRQEPQYYDRAARFAGETKYPFRKMVKLALDGITSFSNAPLQTAYYLGLFVASLSIILTIGIVIRGVFNIGFLVRGWSSMMVAILFLGAVQLITIGILGEYIGRIYDEVKRRPLYVKDEKDSRA